MFNLSGYIDEFGGHNGKYFTRNIMAVIGEENYNTIYQNLKKSCNNKDIYKCPYSYETSDINTCKLYAPFYIDLDGDIDTFKTDEGFNAIKQDVFLAFNYLLSLGFTVDDIDLYFSGSKGFHILISPEILGITPNVRLNELYKAWAYYLYHTYNIQSIDLKVYDRRRLLRIPGSINAKTGLYKVKISIDFLRNAKYKDLAQYASNIFNTIEKKKSRQINLTAAKKFNEKSQLFYNKSTQKPTKKQISIPTQKQILLPCVKNLLMTSIPKGNRNNTAVMLASGILQSGYSIEETSDLLQEWNCNNEPPLDEKEITNTVRSAHMMLASDHKYGCRAFKENGYCTDKCKLLEEI